MWDNIFYLMFAYNVDINDLVLNLKIRKETHSSLKV